LSDVETIANEEVINGFTGLARQADMLADGTVSSAQLVDDSLSAIDATQNTLNAFRIVRHEAARAEAEAADRRIANGERLPLLGVPIAIKDDMDLVGETTPFGCEGDFKPATEDGGVARKLREAGAVIVGKTNSPEIGQWSVTAGPAFGVTRNPWNLDHTPGGSSAPGQCASQPHGPTWSESSRNADASRRTRIAKPSMASL
jgi:amidase